eukprot:2915317-Prymnesium_polylepis.1
MSSFRAIVSRRLSSLSSSRMRTSCVRHSAGREGGFGYEQVRGPAGTKAPKPKNNCDERLPLVPRSTPSCTRSWCGAAGRSPRCHRLRRRRTRVEPRRSSLGGALAQDGRCVGAAFSHGGAGGTTTSPMLR